MRKYFTKQYQKEKEYLKLKNADSDNYAAQRNLGWIELDKPVFKGWEVKLELRDDIKNREDAWLYEALIREYGTSSFIKKKKDFDLVSYNIPNSSPEDIKRFSSYKPSISSITEKEWGYLIPAAKKLFKKDESSYKPWRGYMYKCVVPHFFFEYKFEKYYKTHVRIIDNILKQEAAEIRFLFEKDHYIRHYCKRSGAPKWYRRHLNKSQKAKSKKILLKIINNKEAIFEDCYKGAAWRYW